MQQPVARSGSGATAAAEPIIQASHLTRVIGTRALRTTILDDVTLAVPDGSLFAINGPSGCGKSTLLHVFTGIDRPTSGSVIFAGEPLRAKGENTLARWRGRHVGIIFQFFQLVPTLTALENVLLALELVISANLRERLKRIARAAEAWSHGDFSANVRDAASDELGQLARDLNHMAEQLQTLLESRQELAVVEERNRLARELHDSVKQQVFAGALLVHAARKQLASDPDRAATYLGEAKTLAERTQGALIELIRALRPASLADKGLVQVLGEHADAWSRQTGIAAEVLAQGERATPLDVEEALYRVAQEALANVARHSGARHARVRLAWEDSALRLAVHDDGAGFDPASVAGNGVGLSSMRERVEALAGTLALESAPGATTVTACVPLQAYSVSVAEVSHV
jgi:two-component system, NarL family, sensor histidine kinase LiaS